MSTETALFWILVILIWLPRANRLFQFGERLGEWLVRIIGGR